MKSELLIIRAGDQYIRLRQDSHELCQMNKASVFPLTEKANLLQQIDRLAGLGVSDLRLHKLTIVEEPFVEE